MVALSRCGRQFTPASAALDAARSYSAAKVSRFTNVKLMKCCRGHQGRSNSDGKTIELPPTDPFAVEMDDFAQCILEKKPTRVPGEEGLRDVRIMMALYDMMALYESARTAKPVELPTAWPTFGSHPTAAPGADLDDIFSFSDGRRVRGDG